MGSKMESPTGRPVVNNLQTPTARQICTGEVALMTLWNVICGNTPRVSKGSILEELKRNNIWLSDMGADCPKIDILIGSDNYGKILTGQAIGILDANQNLSNAAEEEITRDQFLSSLTRKENGRYCVGVTLVRKQCGTTIKLPDNERELVDFVKCSTKILADAKMDLRLWTCGPVGEAVRSALDGLNAESTSENIVPVLGIVWDRKGDTLYVECKTLLVSENLSKREVLSLTQSESFPETGDSINGFLTVRDQSGLRRVKTKIIERDDSYAFRYPIILPSRHHIVNCLIRDYHLRHIGPKQTPDTSTFLPRAQGADAEPFSQGVSGTVDPETWTERLRIKSKRHRISRMRGPQES
ncbi:integrase_H2C2 domain-containing protein [Trichonephila clavipes]|nr:integrase_H2C2 domain-containing protein [Trichonephila clavipes]